MGRTVTATEFTLDDLFERLLDGFLESPDGFSIAPMGGLRAGFFTTGSKAITLHGYSWVPGVVLSGKFPTRGLARLTIGGAAAARGTVTIDRHGVLRGRLGGHTVSVRLGAQSVGAARAAAAHLASRQFTPFLSSVLPPG